MDVAEYLDQRTDRSAGWNGCWPWLLSTGSHGYGNAWNGKTVTTAHRLVWLLVNGDIPEELTIDHRCYNQVCCNPNHLRLKTNSANASDNGYKRRTVCPRGHAYSGDNLYVDPEGHRRCRACAKNRRLKSRI